MVLDLPSRNLMPTLASNQAYTLKRNQVITLPSRNQYLNYSLNIESKSGLRLTLSESNAYPCFKSSIYIESKSGLTLPSRNLMPTLASNQAYTLNQNLVQPYPLGIHT
jgi:hypothetical protein